MTRSPLTIMLPRLFNLKSNSGKVIVFHTEEAFCSGQKALLNKVPMYDGKACASEAGSEVASEMHQCFTALLARSES